MVGRKAAGVLAEQCDFLKSPVETALEIEDRDQRLEALSNGARWAATSLGKAKPRTPGGSAPRPDNTSHDLALWQIEGKEFVACWNLAKSAERDQEAKVPTFMGLASGPVGFDRHRQRRR
jgi:hypothetical protein